VTSSIYNDRFMNIKRFKLWIILGLIASIFFLVIAVIIYKNSSKPSPVRTITTQVTENTKKKTGSFIRVDAVHYGQGDVGIYEKEGNYVLQLEENFEVANGPDLYVWLVSKQDLGNAVGGVNTTPGSYFDLGKLEKFTGKQQFSVNKSEFNQYNYAVVIWCKAFGVQFSRAILE
jgi:predicted small secreted protein